MPQYKNLAAGDPAPHFVQRSVTNPRYNFSSAAGRYLVLCFFHNSAEAIGARAIAAAFARPDLFTDNHASFFGVSTDPQDEAQARVTNRTPGYRFLWDMDLQVSRLYGAAPATPEEGDQRAYMWIIIDPTMRIIAKIPFRQDGGDAEDVMSRLAALSPPALFAGIPLQAPILYLPDVFEPEVCRTLIDHYVTQGGTPSGFMREVDGKTIGINDLNHKSRRDVTLEDPTLIKLLQNRVARRVVPEIAKVHQFHATVMERYIVSCYSAEEGGHFAAHRDNTTRGTAHRRFAISINLNDDFDGGEVSFPEYGPRSFKAPPGGAVVFSCSLLHAVSRVTRGQRYAFLPFVYDQSAARIRDANLKYLETTSEQNGKTQTPPGSAA